MTVCAKKAIEMKCNEDTGFLYPNINFDLCVDCNQCKKVCPVLKEKNNKSEKNVFAAYSLNEKIRENSSSGGIFTVIAESVLSEDGVVFGVSMTDDCLEAVHIEVKTIDELSKLRGSKYIQSNVNNSYSKVKKYLEDGKKVLFSGTPCQVAGLKAFLNKEYENLITVDFICHGVPSPLAWQKYVKYREAEAESKTRRTFFRHKKNGWKTYSVQFIFENCTEYVQILTEDLYMRGFLADLYLRESCFSCSFKNNNYQSDITLADFWGIDKIKPEWNDDKGVSLVVSNTPKGLSTIRYISDDLICESVDFEKAFIYNPSYFKSVNKKFVSKNSFRDLNKYSFDRFISKYCGSCFISKVRRKIHLIVCKILNEVHSN